MQLAQAILRLLASIPMAKMRQSLSRPLMLLLPAQKNAVEFAMPDGTLPPVGEPCEVTHLEGPTQINPSGALIWQGKWLRQRTESSSPDLFVHYLSRRKPVGKAVLLSYARIDEQVFESTIRPRIHWLKTSWLADRAILVGVEIARLPAFRKAMASGDFLPLEFIIHRQDTRLDCQDLQLPVWPDR